MNPIHLPKVSWYEGVKASELDGTITIKFNDEVSFTIVEGPDTRPGETFARFRLISTTRNGRLDELIAFMRHVSLRRIKPECIEVDDDMKWLRKVSPMALDAMKKELKKFNGQFRVWDDDVNPPKPPEPQLELPHTSPTLEQLMAANAQTPASS